MQKIVQFIREAASELSRVAWPTRQQTIHYTILVIVISVSTAIFLGILDYFFGIGIGEFLSGGSSAGNESQPITVSPEDIALDTGNVEVTAGGEIVPTEAVEEIAENGDTITVLDEEK